MNRKPNIGTLFIIWLIVSFIFGVTAEILVERLGFSPDSSLLVLSLITVGLLAYASKKRDDYYEDMMKISFDKEAIARAKWLKEKKDEEASR